MKFLKDRSIIYHLVYSADAENAITVAGGVADYLISACDLQIKTVSDKKQYENEIWLGSVSRPNAPVSMDADAFIAEICENHAVIASGDRFGVAVASMKLSEMINAENAEAFTKGKISDLPRDGFYLESVKLARSLYGTYGSWLQKQRTVMKKEDLDDIALVDALIGRMGDGFALEIGSSVALYKGYVVKTDRND